MHVIFNRNERVPTANMLIDGVVKSVTIPYIPSKGIDHRGLFLFYEAKKRKVELKDIVFDYTVEDVDAIKRGFEYMYDPKEVAVSVHRRLNGLYDGWSTTKED